MQQGIISGGCGRDAVAEASCLLRTLQAGSLCHGFVRAGAFRLAMLPVLLIAASQGLSATEPAAALPRDFLAATQSPSAPPPSAEQIRRLIRALGDSDYFVREKAASDLGKLGFDAVDALTAATESDDMEIAARANRLLHLIRGNWSVPGEPPVVSRLLADYESQDDSNREVRIARLVDLPQDQGAAAICRVIRYERSLLLAKTAAVRLLAALAGDAVKPDLAATLHKGLGPCRRAPARWVLAWLKVRKDPQALAGLWTQLAAEEDGILLRQPRDSSLTIVENLLRFQIACCGRSIAWRTPPAASNA